MKRHVWTRRQLVRFGEICDIWEKYHRMGVSNISIYRKYVERQYGVGVRTFYKALNMPVKRLLREMDDGDILITDEKYNRI